MKKWMVLISTLLLSFQLHFPNNEDEHRWLIQELYPFQHHFQQLSNGRMHYIDEGSGDVILFIHGTPTWSFLYRDYIKTLSRTHRCIAIDHLGFGLSEKNKDFVGTPEWHCDNLGQFVDSLHLEKLTLVVHDFGGPIGLGWAVDHPNHIERVVMFNTWLWETSSNPDVKKVDQVVGGSIGKFLYLNANFSAKVLLKKGFADKRLLSKQVHRCYTEVFPDKESRYGPLQLARALAGSSSWYQEKWLKLQSLETKPWLILWGTKDQFITPNFLEKWKARLPHAQVHTFGVGHFVQEEASTESQAALLKALK